MYYHNYRFYLSDDALLPDSKKNRENIEQLLTNALNLETVRVAIDFTSQNRSISVLSTSNDTISMQTNVTNILLSVGIAVNEIMDVEALWGEDEIVPEHPLPASKSINPHTIKKRRKKAKHEHSHEHSHKHSHEDVHEQAQEHSHDHHGHSHDHEEGHENHWSKAALGLLWGAGMLILSIGSFNIPAIAYYAITGLTTLMTLYLGHTVYQSAWNALFEQRWDTTTLYAMSTLTIVAVSIASLFIPGLPMMFEAAPLVLGFWHLGEAIEHTLIDGINEKLDVRDCLLPSVLLKGDPDRDISIKSLIPNDIILVKQGEVIPVDGVLTKTTLLYTTRIDGSPHLKEFQPGDVVKAGMRLADHVPSLEMRVTKTYQNSYLSLIAKNINKANDEKAPVELFADQVLKYFIPGLLGVALVSGIVIGCLFNPALAIQCVISVLVSACPCALSLITPMAVKIGMQKASEQGIHFNNGKSLQGAADIDTIVFDLNGTLTKGEIEVESLRISDKRFLRHIALLEGQSDHPVAKIIKSYVEGQCSTTGEALEITSVDKSHHSGMKGWINGERFMIGNKDMLSANGITHFDSPYDNPDHGSIYIVRGNKTIGQIALADPLREDAFATVQQLKRLGKQVHICTGADQTTAEKYAALLGIPKDNIRANTVGAASNSNEVSKTSYVKQLKNRGCKVAMVGDAANDVTAIAYADIGIAVQSSIGDDDITRQHAGIVIQQGLLFPIVTAFDVAKKTKQNIFQNLFVSLTYNSAITLVAAGLFVALGFALNPAIGVALMVLESTIVLANLYRFKQQELVTVTSNTNEVTNETMSEPSISNALHTLSYGAQPKTSSAIEPEYNAVNSVAGNFFAPKEPPSFASSAPSELVCQV